MAKYRTIRVYPDGNVWVVKKDEAARASAITDTKDEAMQIARDIALNQGLVIIEHGKDGRIKKTIRPEEGGGGSSGGGSGGCFITTACVKYYGLEDDCYQLRTLRKFRDTYLLKSPSGKKLVEQYYLLAPSLAQQLEKDKNNADIYESVFVNICLACKAIENKDLKKAKEIYMNAVLALSNYYRVS